jgi:hypothetical protein
MTLVALSVPTFDNLMRFRVELGIVRKAFEEMDRISTEAHDKEPAARAAPVAVRTARVPQPARGVAPVAAAGLALGFFRTVYTVGGIDVTLEDAMLINELAGLLTEGGMTVYLHKVFNGNELLKRPRP